MKRRAFGTMVIASLTAASARANAHTLPPTPALPPSTVAGLVAIGDVKLFRAEFGEGEPVLFLHGGLAHASYWGHQLREISKRHRAIVVDTRGHGRSTLSAKPFSYELLAADVVGLLDALRIPKAAVVGWSDGAIVGVHLALHRSDRLSRLFAFGANYNLQGLRPEGARSALFTQFNERCRIDYAAMSPAPGEWSKLVGGLRRMWASEPNWTPTMLSRIRVPTTIAGAAFDEIILQAHTKELAAAIPGARLVMMPDVSHFAMLQDPARLTAELLSFLGR